MLAAVLAAAALWLPDAVIRHTARVVPAQTRASIGEALLGHVTRLTGPACADSEDQRCRSSGSTAGCAAAAAGRLVLVPGGAGRGAAPAGGRHRAAPHAGRGPRPARRRRRATSWPRRPPRARRDPLLDLLEAAGPVVAFRLLTTGRIADDVLAAEAERLVVGPTPEPARTAVIDAFARGEVPAAPYAYARDVTGESTLWLIEADPVAHGAARPVLSDGDWVALQGACGG